PRVGTLALMHRVDCGVEWERAAMALGFETRSSCGPPTACSDWDAIRRLPGVPVHPPAAYADLMLGRRANRDVLVGATDILRHRQGGQPAVLGARTHVVVPIVPRLHLGLSILSEG